MEPPGAPRRLISTSSANTTNPFISIALTTPLCCASATFGPVILQVSLTISEKALGRIQLARSAGRTVHNLHISVLRDGRCVTQVHLPIPAVPEAAVSTTLTMSSSQLPSAGVLYVVLYWGPHLQDAAPLLVLPDYICQELHSLFMSMCAAQQQQQQQQLHELQHMVEQHVQGGQQLPSGLSVSVMGTLELEKYVWQHHFRSLAGDLAIIIRSVTLPSATAAAASSSSSSSQTHPNLQHLLSGGSVATSAANSGSSSPRSTGSSSSEQIDPAAEMMQRITLSAITSTAAAAAATYIPWASLIDPDHNVRAQVAGRLAWFLGRQNPSCKETLEYLVQIVIAAAATDQQQQRDLEQIWQQQWQRKWLETVLNAPEPCEAEMLAVQATEDIAAAAAAAAVGGSGDASSSSSAAAAAAAPQLAAALEKAFAADSSSSSFDGSLAAVQPQHHHHQQQQQHKAVNRPRTPHVPTLPTISSGGSGSSGGSRLASAAGSLSSLLPQQLPQQQQQLDHPSTSFSSLAGSPLALLDTLLPPSNSYRSPQQQQQQQHGTDPAAAAALDSDKIAGSSIQQHSAKGSPSAAAVGHELIAEGDHSLKPLSSAFAALAATGGSAAAVAAGSGWSSSSEEDGDSDEPPTDLRSASAAAARSRKAAAAAGEITPPRVMERQRSAGSTTPLPLPGYIRQQQQQQQATTEGLRRRAVAGSSSAAAAASESPVVQTPPLTPEIATAAAAAATAPTAPEAAASGTGIQWLNQPRVAAVLVAVLAAAAVIGYCYTVFWQQPLTPQSGSSSSNSSLDFPALLAQIGGSLLQLPTPVLLLIVLPPLLLLAASVTTLR